MYWQLASAPKSQCPTDECAVYHALTWKVMPVKHKRFPNGSHTHIRKLAKEVEPETCVSGNQYLIKRVSSEHWSESSPSSIKTLYNKRVSVSVKDLILSSYIDHHLGGDSDCNSTTLNEHSKHDEDNSLSSSEAAFSGKSHTIRKDDINKALRSLHRFDNGSARNTSALTTGICDNSSI